MSNGFNYWSMFKHILMEEFPKHSEEFYGEYWESENDEFRQFLSGKADKIRAGIEIIQEASSALEDMDYDAFPQGGDDQCFSAIKFEDEFYKVHFTFRSYGGFCFDGFVTKVTPVVKQVLVYE